MKIRRKKQGNYQVKLAAELENNQLVGAPGTVTIVNVSHDPGCGFLKDGGVCNCNPDMEYAPVFGKDDELE